MAEPAKPKTNNGWLIAFRKYHTWLGLAMTAFIVVIALTGIYLNHKDLFKGQVGKPKPSEAAKAGDGKPARSEPPPEATDGLTTATDLDALPVTFSQAMAVCRDRLGEQPVERIELKNEKGRLVYKVKTASGELVVDAGSGEATEKPRDKGKKAEGTQYAPVVQTAEEYEKEQKGGGTDWGKLIKDLHTGKVGGLAGKLLVDLTALILVVLCLTGVYLYVVPWLRKRRSARLRASPSASQGPGGVAERRPQAEATFGAGTVGGSHGS